MFAVPIEVVGVDRVVFCLPVVVFVVPMEVATADIAVFCFFLVVFVGLVASISYIIRLFIFVKCVPNIFIYFKICDHFSWQLLSSFTYR